MIRPTAFLQLWTTNLLFRESGGSCERERLVRPLPHLTKPSSDGVAIERYFFGSTRNRRVENAPYACGAAVETNLSMDVNDVNIAQPLP